MTGCEACSALVNERDTRCAICGADLESGSASGGRSSTPAPRVHIPVRRYGKAPPPPRAWLVGSSDSAASHCAVAAALAVAILAGCVAAWWPFG